MLQHILPPSIGHVLVIRCHAIGTIIDVFIKVTCCAVSEQCNLLWIGSSTGCLYVWPTRYDRNSVRYFFLYLFILCVLSKKMDLLRT